MNESDADRPIPARPGRPKSDSKRQAIMDAATFSFMDIGYERTSMDAIASGAGVSKQTVYSHFDNKDALFKECIQSKVREYGLDLQDVPPELSFREVLFLTGQRFMDLLNEEAVVSMYRLLIAETSKFPGLAVLFWETGPGETISAIARFLERSAADGQCHVEHPELAARDFICLLQSQYLMRRLMNHMGTVDDQERDAHVTRCVDQFMRLHDHRS